MSAIADYLRWLYDTEKAPEALALKKSDNALDVEIAYCPAVKHLRATGREVSRWFQYSTSVVMQILAEHGRLRFVMDSYDPDTGAAAYSFSKP